MREDVVLLVRGCRADKFTGYSIEHDLYQPEGSFSFSADTKYDINAGDTCEIVINGKLEMTGIIDTVKRGLSRGGPSIEISGRSFASVLCDSCITDFSGGVPTTLPKLAERLVRGLPFIGRKDFVYNNGSAAGKVKQTSVQLSPGDTAFEILKKAANSEGYLFWVSPDGRFVFDRPAKTGSAEYKIEGTAACVNYLEGSVTRTIEDRHSDIIVMGECQDDSDCKYVKTKLHCAGFPFKRPIVISWNENEGPAKKTADLRLVTEQAQAIKLEYTMPGHSQNGKNWAINKFCKVDDDYNGANGVYLISRRSFTLSREEGRRTVVALQPGGLVA
jgi:prophage tail gpP-like protein